MKIHVYVMSVSLFVSLYTGFIVYMISCFIFFFNFPTVLRYILIAYFEACIYRITYIFSKSIYFHKQHWQGVEWNSFTSLSRLFHLYRAVSSGSWRTLECPDRTTNLWQANWQTLTYYNLSWVRFELAIISK